MLLSTPLVPRILHTLSTGPRQQAELRNEAGMPAQTTLRAQLKRLRQIGAIEAQRRDRFPGALEHELSPSGRELLHVAQTVKRWLDRAPNGPLAPSSDTAKAALRALVEGWSTTMLRALATNPLSLTELSRVISSFSYPSLERRLAALRMAGQVEARAGSGRGTPYGVTRWAREGAGPLAAALRWELCHMAASDAPIGQVDAETLLLLAAPLLRLPENAAGSCRMAMELPGSDGPRLAGIVVKLEAGRVATYTSRLQGEPDAWLLGSPPAWLEAIVRGDTDRIEAGGDSNFAHMLLETLHRRLFAEPVEGIAASA